MNSQRSKIRPRSRGAEAAAPVRAPSEEADVQPAMSGDELPGLTVLARLPEVSASSRTLLADQLDWLKKLDWKRLRPMKLDPNWVAGGVLALVLFLLLIITLNRTPKPAPEAAVQNEAPTWKDGNKAQAPTTLTATPNVAMANPAATPGGATQGAAVPGSVADSSRPASALQDGARPGSSTASQSLAGSQPFAGSQGQLSLEGVFYPRTPYAEPTPAGVATQPIDQAVNQPPAASVYGRELRTAQRDVSMPHHAPLQTNSPQSGRAQLEGIISQP
jgi:hypothetical protein